MKILFEHLIIYEANQIARVTSSSILEPLWLHREGLLDLPEMRHSQSILRTKLNNREMRGDEATE